MPNYETTDELIRKGEVHVRFRSFSERFPDEDVEVIAQKLVYFSDVRKLDDVFEGRPLFAWDERVPTRNDLMDMSYRQERQLQIFDRLVLVETMVGNMLDPDFRAWAMAQIENTHRDIYNNSSICCFNTNPRSQRFWGQYAANGSGYALLFDFLTPWPMQGLFNAPIIDMVPFEVVYPGNVTRPIIDLSLLRPSNDDAFGDIEKAVLTKSVEWKDQAEQRLIRVGIPAGKQPFPADSLCGVVLGYDTTPKLQRRRERLIALCRERDEPIPLYEARISAGSYLIELHHLP